MEGPAEPQLEGRRQDGTVRARGRHITQLGAFAGVAVNVPTGQTGRPTAPAVQCQRAISADRGTEPQRAGQKPWNSVPCRAMLCPAVLYCTSTTAATQCSKAHDEPSLLLK